MKNLIYIGADIGGSHITVAAVGGLSNKVQGKIYRKSIDADIEADKFISILGGLINDCISTSGLDHIGVICLAFPGPFDYANGIALFDGSNNKFKNLFAVDIANTLRCYLKRLSLPIYFCNDAFAFALGEYSKLNINESKMLAITLGSGLGAAFINNNKKYNDASGLIPQNGELYNWPYKLGIAEDYFSGSSLIQKYYEKTGVYVKGVKQINDLAAQHDNEAIALFDEFGKELGDFLVYWIEHVKIDTVVIGGSISGAWDHFYPAVKRQLDVSGLLCTVVRSENLEISSITGAVVNLSEQNGDQCGEEIRRITTENLMPGRRVNDNEQTDDYEIYPGSKIAGDIHIHDNFELLLTKIMAGGCAKFDGYQGVDWDFFIKKVNSVLSSQGVRCYWYAANAAFLPDVDSLIKDNLGNKDSIFGKVSTLQLHDFFSLNALENIKPAPGTISFIYGEGASLVSIAGPVIYIDVPKNELQFRMRAGGIRHLGQKIFTNQAAAADYKHCYFVDWPVLNRHKAATIQHCDYLIDGQQQEKFNWISGADYRKGLKQVATQPFRARPWFEPGVWGGKWMQRNIKGLNKDAPNYAWSFELITPENGIVLEKDDLLFETSFDSILYLYGKDVLGADFNIFQYHFPIRFDFLDTIEGGDLSIQCHPYPEYIKNEFGEPFTQDETYYILENEKDSKVYLGFQEDIQPEKFKTILETSALEGKEISIEEFVQSFPSIKHELYLIPHGTIHGSGKGNMVLEISSTPYIFTFKLYDWLRLGLDGKPRPINIEHGFKNLDFSRKGEKVAKEFIAVPQLIESGIDWKRFQLPTHDKHFYDIERYHFNTRITVRKDSKCHVLMLVEGKSITIITKNNNPKQYNYAETFIVPASVEEYEVVNKGKTEAMLVIAYVRAGIVQQP